MPKLERMFKHLQNRLPFLVGVKLLVELELHAFVSRVPGSFPQPIPAGTAVPHYAYLDVQASIRFHLGINSIHHNNFVPTLG